MSSASAVTLRTRRLRKSSNSGLFQTNSGMARSGARMRRDGARYCDEHREGTAPSILVFGSDEVRTCGSGFVLKSRNRLSCFGATDKGISSNHLTIRRDEIEDGVPASIVKDPLIALEGQQTELRARLERAQDRAAGQPAGDAEGCAGAEQQRRSAARTLGR